MTPLDELPLRDLSERHPGLTKAIGESYCEAAAVCLNRHHLPPRHFSIDCNGVALKRYLSWQRPNDRNLRAWANEIDTTEVGAYGVSLAAVESTRGLVAVMRAETLTGADYYISPKGVEPDDLENCIRLEVSGTHAGNMREFTRRAGTKAKQAMAGKSNLPAMVAVVGFKLLVIAISEVVPMPSGSLQ